MGILFVKLPEPLHAKLDALVAREASARATSYARRSSDLLQIQGLLKTRAF
jgi:hypothetical protein